MPMTEKDRKRKRRQRRQKRIRELKERYAQAKDNKSRDIITDKIHRYQPWWQPGDQAES
jgi:hypothetical protein